MRIIIEAPNVKNRFVGHIQQTDFDSDPDVKDPPFTHPTALCGAEVTGPVSERRWVCGKCVALLINNRNDVNLQLDVAEARLRRTQRLALKVEQEHARLAEALDDAEYLYLIRAVPTDVDQEPLYWSTDQTWAGLDMAATFTEEARDQDQIPWPPDPFEWVMFTQTGVEGPVEPEPKPWTPPTEPESDPAD